MRNKDVKFSTLKKGQEFQFGEGFGESTYKKRNDTTANPVGGQEHHVYGFEPDTIVQVKPKA